MSFHVSGCAAAAALGLMDGGITSAACAGGTPAAPPGLADDARRCTFGIDGDEGDVDEGDVDATDEEFEGVDAEAMVEGVLPRTSLLGASALLVPLMDDDCTAPGVEPRITVVVLAVSVPPPGVRAINGAGLESPTVEMVAAGTEPLRAINGAAAGAVDPFSDTGAA